MTNHRIGRRGTIDIRMKDHPMTALASLSQFLEPPVVLAELSENFANLYVLRDIYAVEGLALPSRDQEVGRDWERPNPITMVLINFARGYCGTQFALTRFLKNLPPMSFCGFENQLGHFVLNGETNLNVDVPQQVFTCFFLIPTTALQIHIQAKSPPLFIFLIKEDIDSEFSQRPVMRRTEKDFGHWVRAGDIAAWT